MCVTWMANVRATGNVRGMSVARPCIRGTHRPMSVHVRACPCAVRACMMSVHEAVIVYECICSKYNMY